MIMLSHQVLPHTNQVHLIMIKAVQSNGSGSQVGNVFYDDGILVLTDTGSLKQAAVNEDGTIYGSYFKI